MKTLSKILAATGLAAFTLTGVAFADDVRTPVYPAEGAILGAPYTPGIKLTNGILFVSGQIAYDKGATPDHAKDGKNDMADQAMIVMDKIGVVLSKAGYDFDDAARVTVYMTDIKNYGEFNKVYATYWGEGKIPPARVAVEVSGLPGAKPGAPVLVEVSMIAAK
jgi:2-iminobutanoate/2-iminopropanoate deaminase